MQIQTPMTPKVPTAQEQKMALQGYLRAAEVARRVGCNIATVYRWISTGAVVEARVGHARYIEVRSLVLFLGPVAAKASGLPALEPPPP